MVLVIGGFASGKKEYVKSNFGLLDKDFSDKLESMTAVLYDLQDIAPKFEMDELLPILLKKEIIICNEVGCGLVPIEKEEREAREKIGRICIELAKNAEKVIRVYCGIGKVIKCQDA